VSHPFQPWVDPAPWVRFIGQCVVLDRRDGKVRSCDHAPHPVFATDITDDTQPVIHDADDRTSRCLACFTKLWALRPAGHSRRCAQCGAPGLVYRAPVAGYPNLALTVTACPDHGPGGTPW